MFTQSSLSYFSIQSETTFPSGLSSLDAEKFAANPTMSFHGTHGEYLSCLFDFFRHFCFHVLHDAACRSDSLFFHLKLHFISSILIGPVKKSFPSNFTKQQALLFDTAAALGVPRNVDMVIISALLSICTRLQSKGFTHSRSFKNV